MSNAILKFNDRELKLGESLTTLGRVSDNDVSFSNDSNVSRYHAEIERRGDEFYLLELGSSNGTSVNNEQVEGEKLLKDGDVIVLGGSSQIEFFIEKDETAQTASAGTPPAANAETDADSLEAKNEAEIVKDEQTVSKFPVMLAVAGVVCGLAVVAAVAAVLFSISGSQPCDVSAVITKPENFETLTEATEVAVEMNENECAARAIFLLDGAEFASADQQPFAATLDPKQFPDLADGLNHSLKVVLEDAEGNKMVQPGEVLLVFETKQVATPTPTPTEKGETPTPTPKTKGKVPIIEVQAMSRNLLNSLGSSNYKLDKKFLEEVQNKSAEYAAAENFFARAQQYQDAIKVSYIQENGLPSRLGFILAMSRSKFNPQKQGLNEGLWQMSPEFATANSLLERCGAETLSDASQTCAAKSSALYLKSLYVTVFDERDLIYAVAAFGMPYNEAFAWKNSLPADRSDFWNVIKSPQQREEVVRFFAAGIVAENPKKFGLAKDNPISQLY